MNLFDRLVDEALSKQPKLSPLRVAVEKELLHHDILRILSHKHLLKHLTFIGGTCLRACYGGIRLSEDLCFTGGRDFSRESLSNLAHCLKETLFTKYGLRVVVSEPRIDTKDVNTWKIKIETRAEKKHLPVQRINIDVCSVSSYEKQPMMLINPYGIEMGTSGLIIQAQSREEIYADKLFAFALRPNRLKYRDLWDIVWLHQQGVKPRLELIPKKLDDRSLQQGLFSDLFKQRFDSLSQIKHELEFKKEMLRFLPSEQINNTVEQKGFWPFIVSLMKNFTTQI